MKHSPAKKAGLKTGDELVMVDGKTFDFHHELQDYLKNNKQIAGVILTIKRNNETLEIPVNLTEDRYIGIFRDQSDFFEFREIKYGFLESIPAGINKGVETLSKYIKQFKLIFSPGTKAY